MTKATLMTDHDLTRRQALGYAGAGAALASVSGLAAGQAAGKPVALVTGCSSGFGRLTALELARAGFAVFAGLRSFSGANADAAEALASTARAEALSLNVVDMDVRSAVSVDAAVAAAQAAGPIDVLVNNAGVLLAGSVELHGEDAVREQLETNLIGYHRVARAVLPTMRARRRGLIVQVSSGLGRIVLPTQGWYVATKFALEGMSEALAYELAPFGVEVSIVQPTAYPTQFLANGRHYFEQLVSDLDEERANAYGEQITMTRFGLQDEDGPDPQDVSRAIREIALTEPGRRPMRRVVSPEPDGLQQINAGLAAAQDAVFEGTLFSGWRAAVVD